MGLFDILTGKRKLKAPAESRLFAMGTAAIVFQPLETADFTGIVRDMEEVLRGTGDDAGTQIEKTDDSFGYRWMVLADEDFEDLVVGINVISQALQDGGYGERVLCAVFAFRDANDRPKPRARLRGRRSPFPPQPPFATPATPPRRRSRPAPQAEIDVDHDMHGQRLSRRRRPGVAEGAPGSPARDRRG